MKYFRLILITLFFLLYNLLYSQVETRTDKLLQFADNKKIEWQAKKAKADSLASLYNIPIRLETPGGGLMELQLEEG